jgi:hypothetical protein
MALAEDAPSKYVTLVSGDGLEFVVLREATLVSPTIKGMLRGPFTEAKTGRCTFPEIRYDDLTLSPSLCYTIAYPTQTTMMRHDT